MTQIPTCACGCGEPVPARGARGPAPLYATAACRVRAHRARNVGRPAELIPLEGAVHAQAVKMANRPIDEQIERGILELKGLAHAFIRLGREARPEWSWRCSALGEAILAAIGDSFREVDT